MLTILKTIFCFILSPFRAIFNFLCRKRFRKLLLPTKVSEVNLSAKSQENNSQNQGTPIQNGNSSDTHVVDFQFGQSWNDNWDDPNGTDPNPNTVQELSPEEKIQQYRNEVCRQKSQPDPSEIEPDVNFFEDMEPDNVAQAKFFVGGGAKTLSERTNR